MEKIAKKYLQELQQRSVTMGMQLQLPEELVGLVKCSGVSKGGARHIRRQVQDLVEGPLAVFLLKSAKKHALIKAQLCEGVLQFQA